jgi:hypothetical protein
MTSRRISSALPCIGQTRRCCSARQKRGVHGIERNIAGLGKRLSQGLEYEPGRFREPARVSGLGYRVVAMKDFI